MRLSRVFYDMGSENALVRVVRNVDIWRGAPTPTHTYTHTETGYEWEALHGVILISFVPSPSPTLLENTLGKCTGCSRYLVVGRGGGKDELAASDRGRRRGGRLGRKHLVRRGGADGRVVEKIHLHLQIKEQYSSASLFISAKLYYS